MLDASLMIYTGTEKFETLSEAQAFTREVVKEAQKYDAKVKTNLETLSPPTVSYGVYLPNDKALDLKHTQFAYGETIGSFVGTYCVIGIPFIFGGTLYGFVIYSIWACKEENGKKEA